MDQKITNEQLSVFRNAVNNLFPVPEEDFMLLSGVLHYRKYKKSEIVLQEGHVCRNFWFILKGCFRIYRLENKTEVNVSFFFENMIAADFVSLRHQIPSEFIIEAMEDSETLLSYKRDYIPVLNFSKSLIHLTSRFFQQKYFGEIEHSNTFKLMKPEERYHYLLKHHPKYLQRIPLTHLASYMGISRKTLSRIRSNVA